MKEIKKVLIMGGNGFIGKNLANYFIENGIEVGIYDLFISNSDIKSYQGNIMTDDSLSEIIKQYDVIVYLINSVSPKKSMDFPETSYTQDIPMLLRTLECCVNSNVKRVIFSSSGGTVYGEGGNNALSENTVEQPINHYAICKLTSEKILQLYNKLYGMENMILRISNPYGIGQNPASGVGAITTFAQKIISDEKIMIYGDGSTSRDFIHIDEVCEAFYKAYLWNFDASVTPVFNVGSGQAITLNQIVEIVSETLDKKPIVEYLPSRTFDVRHNVLDMEKTKTYLGFCPHGDETENIKEYVQQLNRINSKKNM